jgi:hypothetical protein
MMAFLENEKRRQTVTVASPKYQQRPVKKKDRPKIVIGEAAPYVPPFNLVVESSVTTPDEKTRKQKLGCSSQRS